MVKWVPLASKPKSWGDHEPRISSAVTWSSDVFLWLEGQFNKDRFWCWLDHSWYFDVFCAEGHRFSQTSKWSRTARFSLDMKSFSLTFRHRGNVFVQFSDGKTSSGDAFGSNRYTVSWGLLIRSGFWAGPCNCLGRTISTTMWLCRARSEGCQCLVISKTPEPCLSAVFQLAIHHSGFHVTVFALFRGSYSKDCFKVLASLLNEYKVSQLLAASPVCWDHGISQRTSTAKLLLLCGFQQTCHFQNGPNVSNHVDLMLVPYFPQNDCKASLLCSPMLLVLDVHVAWQSSRQSWLTCSTVATQLLRWNFRFLSCISNFLFLQNRNFTPRVLSLRYRDLAQLKSSEVQLVLLAQRVWGQERRPKLCILVQQLLVCHAILVAWRGGELGDILNGS